MDSIARPAVIIEETFMETSPLVGEVFASQEISDIPQNINEPLFDLYNRATTIKPLQPVVARESNQEMRTFDSFVVGDSNKFAFGAARAVAENPGFNYNPLFIYGKSGLGKTHLLLAIKDYVSRNHPGLKVTYAQTIDFVNDFTSSLHTRDWSDFSKKYRSSDMLLLDDIQILEGKKETTNEIFNIFNRLKDQNKHVVLSADRAPRDIDLDERYVSRFASGITTDIQPPDFETKFVIFKNYIDYSCRKFHKEDIYIPENIITRIIELSSSNIRELEGAATSLIAYMTLERQNKYQSLTIEEAERTVEKVFLRNETKRIDVSTIQYEVEKYFGVSHADLIGPQRSQNITYPRQVAMYLSRSLTSDSFPDIGKAFGGKDHTSVMYAVNNIEKKRQADRTVFHEIEKLTELLKN
jgi:chromosomal replication initiator protein